MARITRVPLVTMILLSLLATLAIGGCNDSDLPTGPVMPLPGRLSVQAFSTATQIEPGGFRIQVRMRVLAGLPELARASRMGAALAQTCRSGRCIEGLLGPDFMEASCAGVAAEIAFGTAWVDGDVVGVDFCVADLTGGATFETTLMDGLNRSNVVRTVCTATGSSLFCGSES